MWRDELLEAERGRLPFGKDRAAVKRDPLGQHARLADALSVERHALVEAAELHRMVEAERAGGLRIGDFLDQQHDVAEAFAER